MNPLLEGLKALGPGRIAALAAVGIAMLGLLTVLAVRGPSTQMASLYSDLDLREAGQIAELLDKQKIPHQIASGGTQIMVASDDVARARLSLAREGLPTGGSMGYELLDRTDSLTATQFQQAMNQSRALEGELARTIRSVQGVKAARVHLVLPKREPFSRDRQDAQASVLLTMTGNARLDREGISAIVNLIAAAVPGLRPQNVAVTDTRGNLLARAGEQPGVNPVAASNDQQRVATELRLSRAVEEMLERSLGPGRARAETTIAYDYEQLHETQERYDPEGQVVRSTQTVSNNSKTSEAAAAVSVQNNLPNADAGTPGAGTSEQRQEETTNFEVTKTVRTIIHDQPKITRISMAVMVDGVQRKQPDGTFVWQERPPEELAQITKLVRTAIGFDESRGDKVEIVTLRFAEDPDAQIETSRSPLPFGIEKSDLMRLAQTGLVGALALIAMLFVMRPMVRQLSVSTTSKVLGADPAALALLGRAPGEAGAVGSMASGHAAIAGPGRVTALLASAGVSGSGGRTAVEDESMLSITQIEGQLKASSVRRIADLVERHPDESLSIVRAWMTQEPA